MLVNNSTYAARASTRNYDPSPSAWVIILLLTLIFEAALILAPAILSGAPARDEPNTTVVPPSGTAEYDQFKADFEAKYGRPYTVRDEMTAVKNGGLVLAAYMSAGLAFTVLCLTVHDNICWFSHRRVYKYERSGDRPRDSRTQFTRTAFTLVCAALLGMWYPMLPWLIRVTAG